MDMKHAATTSECVAYGEVKQNKNRNTYIEQHTIYVQVFNVWRSGGAQLNGLRVLTFEKMTDPLH